ncbi:hypothetical protein ABIC16_000138 [Sphingomonas sp. PvP055]|uniref:excalibur calcium-binding domain-containing protein n=1 Tax=Sphingomonas sp. PvP055 TaxID=3156391 RepID=UPI0033992438
MKGMRNRALPILPTLLGAAVLGVAVGLGSTTTSPSGPAALGDQAQQLAVSTGLKRQRAPQAGDAWGGCNDARSAGTFPIYRGEPGYRTDMDGDGDGVACEPHG